MKICILSIVNIKHMSLISLYTSFFEKNGIEYDIIYIDKYNEEEKISANNVYRFPLSINRKWNKMKKLAAYWKFKDYAESIIKKNKYDFVIVWRTETAIMFSNFLSKNLKGNYCINIRDYCMEKNPFVFFRVKHAIKSSRFTTISSDGFKKFLPKYNYLTVHSYNEELLLNCKPKIRLNNYNEPIRICFIGYVRFFDIDKKLIDALGNDHRYIIQFFGEGSQELKTYADNKGIVNTEFIGGFPLEDTVKLLGSADVINNLYGFNNIALDTAISTKFYYALHQFIPILVFKKTFMEEISKECGLGFAVGDDFSNLADTFYEWYHSLSFDELKWNCLHEIEEIKKSNSNFQNLLENTFMRNF